MRRALLMLIALMALLVLVALAIIASRRPAVEAPPSQYLRFALTDHHGAPFSDRDLAGRFALVYFGYTFCPDICPTELGFVHRLLTELGPVSERLTPLFITIDPARDTPAVLAEYAPLFNPRLIGLTGTPEAIAAAAKSVGAFFQRNAVVTKQPDFYLMDHSLSTYLIGPDGAVLARYDSRDPFAPSLLDLRRRLTLESP